MLRFLSCYSVSIQTVNNSLLRLNTEHLGNLCYFNSRAVSAIELCSGTHNTETNLEFVLFQVFQLCLFLVIRC